MTSHMPIAAGELVHTRIPWLWFVALAVLLLLTQYTMTYVVPESNIQDLGDRSVRRQVSISVLGLLGAVLFLTAGGWRLKWHVPLFLVSAAMGMWVAVSIQWSSNPSVAFRRLAIFVLMFVGAYGLNAKWPSQLLLSFVVFSASVQLTAGVLSEIVYGSFSPFDPAYRFSGNLHPNGQGQLCAVLALASVAALRSTGGHKLLFRFAALYGVTFLLLTRSLTSIAGFLAGITAFSFLRFSTGRRFRFVYLGVMVLLIAGLLMSAFGFSLDPIAKITARNPDKMVTLTGRVPLWAECMKYIAERPLFGYGYEGFWTPERREDLDSQIDWGAGSAHSAYIELWLTLGIVGLVLHTSILLLVLRRATVLHRATQAPEYAAAVGLSAQLFVFGALESITLFKFSAILFYSYCLFLMVALAVPSGGIPAFRRRES